MCAAFELSWPKRRCEGPGPPGEAAHLRCLGSIARHWDPSSSCSHFSDKYVEAGRGAPERFTGPTSRATMESPGLIISCTPALPALSRGCCLESKECRLPCHLAPLRGTWSNVSYLIGNLTWLLNNPINQTQLVLLELMSPGNAAVNNEGLCLSPSNSPHPSPPIFFSETRSSSSIPRTFRPSGER